jgi:hypothetical protein
MFHHRRLQYWLLVAMIGLVTNQRTETSVRHKKDAA